MRSMALQPLISGAAVVIFGDILVDIPDYFSINHHSSLPPDEHAMAPWGQITRSQVDSVLPTGFRTAGRVWLRCKQRLCWCSLFRVVSPSMWCGSGVTTLAAVTDKTDWDRDSAFRRAQGSVTREQLVKSDENRGNWGHRKVSEPR